MISSDVTSKLLPVSILAGPAVRALLGDIVTTDSERRFGLLTGSSIDSNTDHGQLMVEQLAVASGGDYDLERIGAQISTFAETTFVDHLIIECDSATHPIAFASLFLPNSSHGRPLSEMARLSSVLLAIDSETLLSSLVRGDRVAGVKSPCILADQVECADVIVLDGKMADRDLMLARAVVSALNPHGRIVQRSRDAVPVKLLDAEKSFDFEATFAGARWRKMMEEEPGTRQVNDGITTFVYRVRRPFHPEKFWNLIQHPFPRVFRAKGFFWLATRMSIVGGLNIAGSECHCSPAGQWWAATAHGRDGDHEGVPDRLKHEWAEPFGDRRQAIAFMGIGLDSTDLSARLDACLLSQAEMNSDERNWATLPDPFPTWSSKARDHECDDRDCCSH